MTTMTSVLPSGSTSELARTVEEVRDDQAKKLADLVVDAYPQVAEREQTRSIFAKWLVDLPYNETEQVVMGLIADSRTMPTVADIRRDAIEKDMELPTATEAWNSLTDPKLKVHDLAKEVAVAFGGVWGIKTSEEPQITRTQYVKEYEIARERALRGENLHRFQRQYRRDRHQAA